MKVLFFSAWYPSKRDAMAGLFVQKHAESVAQQGADVRVLYSDATSHLDNYPAEHIRPYGEKYRYETVGKELMAVYHSVCNPRS